MKFKDLPLSDEMKMTLEKIGYEEATEIQQESIPVALEGKDIIGQAQTGTGKTASFGIPIIEKTIPGAGIQHLVLAPSRELAKQIQEELIKLSSLKRVKVINIIGGVSYDIQRRDLAKNPDIIIATPGRFIDHLESQRMPIDLSKVNTFVLDEADEMLNFGFYKEMIKIGNFLPKKRQTLFFTATFNKKTKTLANELLKDPVDIKVSTGMSTNLIIEQKYVVIKEKQKLSTLFNLLQIYDHKSVIIFGRTRRRVDELSEALIKLGFAAKGIQGDMKQRDRERAMGAFRDGKIKILVGTDVLARGIDIDTVDLVFNFDLPTEMEYYTHRIGRTGRAGKKGTAISFVKDSEQVYFQKLMNMTGSEIEKINRPSDEDMYDIKVKNLDAKLSALLHIGREKYRNVASKISEEYTPEHLGLMLAAAAIKEEANPYNLSLTGEPGADDKGGGSKKRRSGGNRKHNNRNDRNRKRSNSRGRRSNFKSNKR